MRKPLFWKLGLATAFTTAWINAARADVAPPPGYIEQCTLEKKQGPGQSCVACRAGHSVEFMDAASCQSQYESLGYTQVCSSYGASVWTEIWCRPDADAGTAPTNRDGDCGCSMVGNAHHQRAVAAVALLALALACVRRRIRST